MLGVLHMIEATVSIVGSVLTVFIVILIKRLISNVKKDRDAHNTLSIALRSLLKSQILQIYNEAVPNDSIRLYDKDMLDELYNNYKILGGNGFITGIMSKVNEMNIIT